MATLGIVAGLGALPLEVAQSARTHGWRVVVVGLRELARAELADAADHIEWHYLGEVERAFRLFEDQGVEAVVMAGKVPKTFLWERADAVRPDARAAAILARGSDRADDTLLGLFADEIEASGYPVRGQAELVPDIVARVGPIGSIAPTEDQWADIAFGWPYAKQIGAMDVGQTVVVQDRAVLALEAVEGTDRAIARGQELSDRARGVSVVKVAKPSQDPRFDVPVIGPDTIALLAEGPPGVIAVEAGATVLLRRAELLRAADAGGVAIVGVDAENLAPPGGSAP